MTAPTLDWIICGAGRVGRALGLLAADFDIPIRATYNRSAARARQTAELLPHATEHLHGDIDVLADALRSPHLVWVTVSDAAIALVATQLAPLVPRESVVVHTAGSLGSNLLKANGIKASCGSLHPLQAISAPRPARRAMAECTWTVEGEARAVQRARAVMRLIGVTPVAVDPSAKALYHASAVTAANLMVALVDAAYEMAALAGIPEAQAQKMLLPLVQSSLDNLKTQPPAKALTGPAARGDDATIRRHQNALGNHSELSMIYNVLMERSRDVARRNSAPEEE